MIKTDRRSSTAPAQAARTEKPSEKKPEDAEPKGKLKAKGKGWAKASGDAHAPSTSTKFESTKAVKQTGGHKKTDPATIGNPPDGQPGLMKDWKADQVSYQKVDGSLKLSQLTYDDLKQGDSGDCYFLSSAVAVAHDNPDALKKVFTENADGTTTVHFFEKQKSGPPKKVDITVDNQFPVGKDGIEYASARDDKQLWPQVLEKAYAKWKGGYENIGEGGEAKDALMALTGKTSTYTPELSKVDPDKTWQSMTQATADHRPMVSGTFDEKHQPVSYKKEDIIEGHDYTVLKAYESNGERLVDVRNPWGSDQWKGDLHPHDQDGNFTMKYDDFLKRFEDLTILNSSVADAN
jgi:hypothetical protein